MSFTSQSQAGQDRFVWEVTGHKSGGTFLDIGAWPFVVNSNTFALEKMGWRGLLVDLQAQNGKQRVSPLLQCDATKINWLESWNKFRLPKRIDYLSLDVDEFTTETLIGLPLNKLRFRVLTVEHDSYWLGPGPRDKQREILKSLGYDLVCEDVMVEYPTPGDWVCFEDFYVSPELSRAADRFRCVGKKWTEIVK